MALRICQTKQRPIKTQQNSCNTAESSCIQADVSVLKVTWPWWKIPGRSKQQRSRDLSLHYVTLSATLYLRNNFVSKNKYWIIKQPQTNIQALLLVSLLSGLNLTLYTLKGFSYVDWLNVGLWQGWLAATRLGPTIAPHHNNIQHNKLLKCGPSLKPEDYEFTVKPNNEQAHSAYYFTHSCHLPLPRVCDSQLNLTGT